MDVAFWKTLKFIYTKKWALPVEWNLLTLRNSKPGNFGRRQPCAPEAWPVAAIDPPSRNQFFLFIPFQVLVGVLITVHSSGAVINSERKPDINMDLIEEPPEGYYAFIESPGAEPPKVRRPPYVQSEMECPGFLFTIFFERHSSEIVLGLLQYYSYLIEHSTGDSHFAHDNWCTNS